jgi:hypothetical protein
VRQREEHLKSLVNIWDPEAEMKARKADKYRTRADHAGKPVAFPPGTEGMLGRQYTEAIPLTDTILIINESTKSQGFCLMNLASPETQ